MRSGTSTRSAAAPSGPGCSRFFATSATPHSRCVIPSPNNRRTTRRCRCGVRRRKRPKRRCSAATTTRRSAPCADHRTIVQGDQKRGFVAAIGRGDEILGVGDTVGMRNARRVLGDVAVVGERRDRFSVPEARRAQHQPRGLEDGDTAFSESLRWDVLQAGHGRLLGFESCSERHFEKHRGGAGIPSPPLGTCLEVPAGSD